MKDVVSSRERRQPYVLDELKNVYAKGDITFEQFEWAVDQVLLFRYCDGWVGQCWEAARVALPSVADTYP